MKMVIWMCAVFMFNLVKNDRQLQNDMRQNKNNELSIKKMSHGATVHGIVLSHGQSVVNEKIK
jgi:hypothetical protein